MLCVLRPTPRQQRTQRILLRRAPKRLFKLVQIAPAHTAYVWTKKVRRSLVRAVHIHVLLSGPASQSREDVTAIVQIMAQVIDPTLRVLAMPDVAQYLFADEVGLGAGAGTRGVACWGRGSRFGLRFGLDVRKNAARARDTRTRAVTSAADGTALGSDAAGSPTAGAVAAGVVAAGAVIAASGASAPASTLARSASDTSPDASLPPRAISSARS